MRRAGLSVHDDGPFPLRGADDVGEAPAVGAEHEVSAHAPVARGLFPVYRDNPLSPAQPGRRETPAIRAKHERSRQEAVVPADLLLVHHHGQLSPEQAADDPRVGDVPVVRAHGERLANPLGQVRYPSYESL